MMTKQDWIRKITSRKFWVAIAGLVAGIIKFMQNPTTDAQAISSLILLFGSVVAYIIGEGLVDAARASDADAAKAVWNGVGEAIAKPPEGEQTTMDFDPDGDDGK